MKTEVLADGHQEQPPAALPEPELKRIPYHLIDPDPNQPRKTFNEATLDELALSIREQGLVQPLLVELVPALYKVEEPDIEHPDEWAVRNLQTKEIEFRAPNENLCLTWSGTASRGDRYRIVAGERRWRACAPRVVGETSERLPGLDPVPCLVVPPMDARRKFAAQFIENHQRENISALEEAQAFATELQRQQETDPAVTVEAFGATLGLKRATAYERLKLTRIRPSVEAALRGGKIEVSVACELAKIPDPAAQDKLLKEITNEEQWDWPYSVRDVKDKIEEQYVRPLQDAVFDVKETYPDPNKIAGVTETLPACKDCPHRTGNLVHLWPDLKARQNVCTHLACYKAKEQAHWAREAEKQAAAGKTVIAEKDFKKQKRNYIAGDKHEYAQNKSGTFEVLMGKHRPEPVLVATAEGLKKFYPKEDAMTACKRNGVKFYTHSRSVSPEERAKEEAAQKAGRELHDKRIELLKELVPLLAPAFNKMTDVEAWARLNAAVEVNQHGEFGKALLKICKTDRARVVANELSREFGGGNAADWNTGRWDPDCLKLWQIFGVDVKAEEAKRDQAAQPALALNGKKAPEQKELLTVKRSKSKKKK